MRAAAPPYRGEGPRALWHVSEDPTITHFAPRLRRQQAPTDQPLVWAIDTRHLPLYWFPRDCPRCTFWASDRTTDADVARFLDGRRSARVHVIEGRWLERVATTALQLYRMPERTFMETPDSAGFWSAARPSTRSSERRSVTSWAAMPRPAFRSGPSRTCGRSGTRSSRRRWSSAGCASATRCRTPRSKRPPIHSVWPRIRGKCCAGSHRTRSNFR